MIWYVRLFGYFFVKYEVWINVLLKLLIWLNKMVFNLVMGFFLLLFKLVCK